MPLTVVDGAMLSATNAQYTMFKSRIINGSLDIWQRGTSFSNTANSYQYTADRWVVFGGVGIPAASSRVATGLQNFPYALRVQRPAGNTGTSNTLAGQVIETINCRDLSGQTTTVSFLARAGANYSTAGNRLDVLLVTGTGTDQGATNAINAAWTAQAYNTQSVTLTTSFVQYSLTFTVPVGTNEIMFYFAATNAGTAGAADYFDITGVQYEKGSTATAFDYRPYSIELQLSQRYFQIYADPRLRGVVSSTVSLGRIGMPILQKMRVNPTASTTGTYQVYDGSGTASFTTLGSSYYTTDSVEFDVNITGSLTTYRPAIVYISSGSGVLSLSAEL